MPTSLSHAARSDYAFGRLVLGWLGLSEAVPQRNNDSSDRTVAPLGHRFAQPQPPDERATAFVSRSNTAMGYFALRQPLSFHKGFAVD